MRLSGTSLKRVPVHLLIFGKGLRITTIKSQKSVTKLNNSKESILSKMSELWFEMIKVKCFFGIKTGTRPVKC